MTPDRFLQKLVDVLGMIKAPVIIIICCIAIIQVISAVFIGGHDKRAVFSTVLTLLMIAAILFSLDRLILWMADFFGR